MSTAAIEAEITAFFEDYIDTVNKSWTSKKALERRRGMFADTCSDCLAGYRFAKRAHQENLTITGEDLALIDLDVTSANDDLVVFVTREDSPAGELVTDRGDVVQEFDEYLDAKTEYRAKRSGNHWVIVQSDPL